MFDIGSCFMYKALMTFVALINILFVPHNRKIMRTKKLSNVIGYLSIVNNHRECRLLLANKLHMHIKWASVEARLHYVFISGYLFFHVVRGVGALCGNCTLNAPIHCFYCCWPLIN